MRISTRSVLRYESGFTDGTLGFGLDALGQLGLTGKVRVSQTVLKMGTLQPQLPVAAFNDTRLLPSAFISTGA